MNTSEWPAISHTAGSTGLKAFNKVWYTKEKLTDKEDKLLRELFVQYPMGVGNYNIWCKQRVRQLSENFTKGKEDAIQI